MTKRRNQQRRNAQAQYTQLANVENRLKEISNRIPTVEEKYSSRNLVFSYLNYSSPSLFRFTDLSQGTDVSRIIGNVVYLKDLSLRFTVTHYTSGPSVQFIRVIIFKHLRTSPALSASGAGGKLLDE
jgi:hypothetical protein